MTVTLLAALAQHKGAFVGNSVAAAYNSWAHSNPFDIGMATRSALFVRESGLQNGLFADIGLMKYRLRR